ncbi:ATP-binding protein [Streptomyces sp. NPDC001922]|uniref:ATP-binding protein n=1 Tax=Streptomyces sp. NPDC001922 TaxID=3364624 RepID=UPI00368EBF67
MTTAAWQAASGGGGVMQRSSIGAPRLRCVLPFEAAPAELSALRGAVRSQLFLWGMPAVSDEAQLAVTELATNVIRHVGEGAAATLILEPREHSLRVELHDTSHAVPAEMPLREEEEWGRGLLLIAGMALNWGTVITAVGKAVWCELPLTYDQNCRRIQRVTTVLDAYRGDSGGLSPTGARWTSVLENAATVLIADLLHWLSAQGRDPDDILDRAQTHFEAEVAKV